MERKRDRMEGREVLIVQGIGTPALEGPSMALRRRSVRKARGPRGRMIGAS